MGKLKGNADNDIEEIKIKSAKIDRDLLHIVRVLSVIVDREIKRPTGLFGLGKKRKRKEKI
jgi:hypothetical protein